MHVGESSKSFVLGCSPEERVLEFVNSRAVKAIRINVPSPASPRELGLSSDARRLGIGLVEMRIEARK
jgi:phosphoglycerol transferase